VIDHLLSGKTGSHALEFTQNPLPRPR